MTREDAIKKVRCGLLGLIIDKDVRDALETLIPELRESEDERIRKWILEKVQEYADSSIPCSNEIQMANKTLAWLEKQKENPKSADSIPSDCVSDAKCEDKSQKHSDSDGTDIRDTPAYWKGWDDAMKQKEQKHPNGCFTCDEYKKGYEAGRLNGFTAGYNKAMKEVDQKEQKPAWSEEDEKMRDLIVAIFEVNHPDDFFKANELGTTDMRGVHTEEIISWLKSLRLQPKRDGGDDYNKGYIKGRADTLKEFADMSSWKPSEEQQEVDLKEEIEEYWVATGWSNVITLGKFKVIARYFYGLGQLNSK